MRPMTHDTARPLRPVHVVAGLDPADGGPSYSVPRLCEALAAAGAEPVLLSVITGRIPPATRRTEDIPTGVSRRTSRMFPGCGCCAALRHFAPR